MTAETEQPRRLQAPTPRVALVIAALVVVGVVLYMARHALTPFIIGALIVYLLDPAVSWVSRVRIGGRSVPRGLSVLIVYVVTVIVIYQGMRLLLGPLITQLIEYVKDLPTLIGSLEATLASIGEAYRALGLPAPVRDFIDGLLTDLGEGTGSIDFGSLLPIATTILGTAASFFAFLIIPIWAFYILRDRVRLQEQLTRSLPADWRDEVLAVLSIIERVFGRWIRGQLLLGLIVGSATFVGLLILGWTIDPRFIQFAVFLAVIAGVLELLPIIGPIISMIPTLLVALTTNDPTTALIGVVVLYLIVQQVENAILVPKIQGDAVQLHPSLVIFALIIGGSIAGLLGAILAIPITAAARDVYKYLFHRLSGEEVSAVDPPPPPDKPPAATEPPLAADKPPPANEPPLAAEQPEQPELPPARNRIRRFFGR